jgi:hypothetical protein
VHVNEHLARQFVGLMKDRVLGLEDLAELVGAIVLGGGWQPRVAAVVAHPQQHSAALDEAQELLGRVGDRPAIGVHRADDHRVVEDVHIAGRVVAPLGSLEGHAEGLERRGGVPASHQQHARLRERAGRDGQCDDRDGQCAGHHDASSAR